MKYRKHIRLKSNLYNYGWFFITIITKNREQLFLGEGEHVIEKEFTKIAKRHHGWQLDWFVIMPDHVHFILYAEEENETALSGVVGAFKSLAYRRFRLVFERKQSLWQSNYYEHIIRTDQALENIRRYIEANPLKEQLDWKVVEKNL